MILAAYEGIELMGKKKEWFEKNPKVKLRLALCLVGAEYGMTTIPTAPPMVELKDFYMTYSKPSFYIIEDMGEIELEYEKFRKILATEHKFRLKKILEEGLDI